MGIVNDILVSAMGGSAKKTHKLYKANISGRQADNHFSALLAHNLDGNNVYCTTKKGMKFIECCEEIRSLIGLVMNNRRINHISNSYAFDGRR
ncbi:MAG TPA: winged helix-turn-helix domain-containing protein [Nitrososphaera sp.]|nr:winged helix-turn-helix domain-containing protein [Nitrososphaera sp.]